MSSAGARPEAPRGASQGFVSRNAWAPYAIAMVPMVCWSGATVLARAIRQDIPPMGLVLSQSVIAALILLPFLLPRLRTQMPVILRHWKLMLALGVTQLVTGQGLLYIALHTTTAINAGLIVATQPAVIMALAWLLLRNVITLRQGAGLLIALIGVLAIITRGEPAALLDLSLVIGDLWMQLVVISFSLYVVLITKYAPKELNPFVLFFAMIVAAIFFLLPIHIGEAMITGGRVMFDGVTILTVLYMAVFSTILALVCLNVAIAHIGPGRLGIFYYLIPVITALLAMVLLGEAFHLYHLVAVVLVLGGVYISSRSRVSRS